MSQLSFQRFSQDALTEQQARAILTSVSVVRDPIHGDIRLTKLDRCVIDTPDFQRLRHIQQLAMVDVTYPGATHTRFLHSLGVLHVCAQMISACNNSAKIYRPFAPHDHPVPVRIGFYTELLARLVALTHDMAHIPFGHVLEREAHVLVHDEWEDTWRAGRIFGPHSELRRSVRRLFVEYFEKATDPVVRMPEGSGARAADILIDDVRAVLEAKRETVVKLRYPFIYDLVSNTICADLIDYVQRDMYFTGLTEGIGKRFMEYLAVIPVEYESGESSINKKAADTTIGKAVWTESDVACPREEKNGTIRAARIVLMKYRYNERRQASSKGSIISEAIDLVRQRKVLAEKLYFHKTKLSATSMLGAAAFAAQITSAEDIWTMSDRELLRALVERGKDVRVVGKSFEQLTKVEIRQFRAKKLAQKLLERKLFKVIYRIPYHKNDDSHVAKLLWQGNGVYPRFSNPTNCESMIDQIEKLISLSRPHGAEEAIGSVSISCPDEEMQLKAFAMLVMPGPTENTLMPLEKTVASDGVKAEIAAIKQAHRELWRFEVLVDPMVVPFDSELAAHIAGGIFDIVKLPNEIPEVASARQRPLTEIVYEKQLDAVFRKLGKDPLHSDFELLRKETIAARHGNDLEERVRTYLATKEVE